MTKTETLVKQLAQERAALQAELDSYQDDMDAIQLDILQLDALEAKLLQERQRLQMERLQHRHATYDVLKDEVDAERAAAGLPRLPTLEEEAQLAQLKHLQSRLQDWNNPLNATVDVEMGAGAIVGGGGRSGGQSDSDSGSSSGHNRN